MLLEDAFGVFQPDRKHIVFESMPSGRQCARISGRLSLCDTVNGNNRRYSRRVWEKNLKEGSPLQEAIKRNAAFGLLEHPADGQVDLRSPIAILVTKAVLTEDNGVPVVDGEILILGTPEGQRLVALIEAGWNPTVSSRGYGSLVKGPDGVDEVQDDYVCEGWDVVIKPSFSKAVLMPEREQLQVNRETTLSSSTPQLTSLKESAPPSTQPKKTCNTMIQEIRNRLTALKGVDTSKLTPAQYANGIAEMQELHQKAADYLAEDAKRSWEVNKLHAEISELEAAWSAAMKPTSELAKLQEDYNKLLKVTNAVVESAVKLKKLLGERTAQVANLQELLEHTLERGKSWKLRAESAQEREQKAKAELVLTERRFDFACRGLEHMAERYKSDVTRLGKRLLELQFKDKLEADKDLLEELKKATKLSQVTAIREKLTGTAKAEDKPQDKQGKQDKLAEDNKGNKGNKDAQQDKLNEDNKPVDNPHLRSQLQQVEVLNTFEPGPQSISESVAVARRLSQAATMAL
jgi:hypothetical protein